MSNKLKIKELLPAPYRNRLNDSLLDNIFDKFISKDDSSTIIGHIGSRIENEINPNYISAKDLDRNINSLIPMLYSKHGSEYNIFNFDDLKNKFKILGIEEYRIKDILKDKMFNFYLPIDLDKFCNFNQYFWVSEFPSHQNNPECKPEYYVIESSGKSDWAIYNFWVHKDDFQSLGFDINKATQAKRPIIEYRQFMEQELNNHYIDDKPCDKNTPNAISYKQEKTRFNQKPMFNLYKHDGTTAFKSSSIIEYKIDNNAPVDAELDIKAQQDSQLDFIMHIDMFDDSQFLFYKNDNKLQSVWYYASEYVPSFVTLDKQGYIKEENNIKDNINSKQHTWIHPLQYSKNINHQNKQDIKYADLLSHFLDIIKNQPNLTGSPFGSNNYRNITKDYSKGGKIKEFDGNFDLFISIMNQKDVDYINIVRYAQYSYELMLSNIQEYIKKVELEQYLNNDNTLNSPDYFVKLKSDYLQYVANDLINFDTTSYYKGLPITLPYMGLCEKVEPKIEYNHVTKSELIIHHDGHKSSLAKNDVEYKRQLAEKKYKRSDDRIVAGYINNNNPISFGVNPYKKQFWYNPTTDKLYVFDVAFDIFDSNIKAMKDSYGYDRNSKKIYQYNGVSWNEVVKDAKELWVEYSFKTTTANLTLSIEKDLYNNCPDYGQNTNEWQIPYTANSFDYIRLQNKRLFDSYMEKELYRYAAIKNTDPYINTLYKEHDPFTWNYSSVSVYGKNYATWYDMYQDLFGSLDFNINLHQLPLSKPLDYFNGLNLSFNKQIYFDNRTFNHNDKTNPFPDQLLIINNVYHICKITGIKIDGKLYGTDKITYDYDIGKVIENGTQYDIDNYYIPYYADNYQDINHIKVNTYQDAFGKTLPINPYTLELLPPFVNVQALKSQSLVTKINKHAAKSSFSYGQNGFFEYMWKNSINYNYAKLITLFKINPYKMIVNTWGYNNKPVQDGYNTLTIDRFLNRKRTNKDYVLHGEISDDNRKSNLAISDNNGRLDVNVSSNFKRKIEIVRENGNWVVYEYEEELLTPTQKRLGVPPNWQLIKTTNIGNNSYYFNTDLSITIYPSIFPRQHGDKYEILIDNRQINYSFIPVFYTKEYALKIEVSHILPSSLWYRVELVSKKKETEYELSLGISHDWQVEKRIGFTSNKTNQYQNIKFTILDDSNLKVGDIFYIYLDVVGKDTKWNFIPSPVEKFNGLNQVYVNYMRYNNIDIKSSENVSIFRDWEVKLGWRTSGLMNNNNLFINSDYFKLASDNYQLLLKENKYIKFADVQSLRVSVIKYGATDLNGYRQRIPRDNAEDWVFRIEPVNKNTPFISILLPDTEKEFFTFNALASERTDTVWKRYKHYKKDDNGNNITATISLPLEVQGLQTVIDILFGYVNWLHDNNWFFSKGENSQIDEETGRVIDWQLEIEKCIDRQYVGNVKLGSGYLLSPFKRKVWYKNQYGMVSEFKNKTWNDNQLTPYIADLYSQRIDVNKFRVIRSDDYTEIISDVPMFYVNLNVSEYEHVILFDNYTLEDYLIYDDYLGLQISRLHIRGERQNNYNGKLTFNGHFAYNNSMLNNIDKSITDISDAFDVNKLQENNSLTEAMKQQVGFIEKDYFKNLDLSERGKFQLWQGIIKNKGTNYNIEAFINNSRYNDAKVDEYWLIKTANYGDNRQENHTEINLKLQDHKIDYSHFVMDDNQEFIPKEAIFLNQNDERIWHSIEDLNNKSYFEAVKHKVATIRISSLGYYIVCENDLIPEFVIKEPLIDLDVQLQNDVLPENDSTYVSFYGAKQNKQKSKITGKLANYDFYEMVIHDDRFKGITIPEGEHDLIPNLASYETFKKINSHVIQITDDSLIGYTITLYGYHPAYRYFNPAKLIENKTKHIEEFIELYDPARTRYKREVLENIDIFADNDPALYNVMVDNYKNEKFNITHSWGKEKVGKIWLDTSKLAFYPYFDYKRFPDLVERITKWGAIADWSLPELNQWVESDFPPEQYNGSGIPSKKELYTRTREWYGRTIVWKKQIDYDNQLYDVEDRPNYQIIIKDNKLYSTNEHTIPEEYMVSGVTRKYDSENEVYIDTSFFGEAEVISEPYYEVESFIIPDDNIQLSLHIHQDNISIGDIKFQFDNRNGFYYITCINNNNSQSIILSDSQNIKDYTYNFNFNEIGVTLSVVIVKSHDDPWNDIVLTQLERIVYIGEFITKNKFIIYKVYDIQINHPFILNELINIFGDNEKEITWVLWTKPDYRDIEIDTQSPYNRYKPELGIWNKIDISKDNIYNNLSNRREYRHLGNSYNEYKYVWGEYVKLEEYIHKFVYLRYEDLYKKGIEDINPEMYLNGKRIFDVSYENDIISYNIEVPDTDTDIFVFGLDSVIMESSKVDFVIMENGITGNGPDISKMQVIGVPKETEELTEHTISILGAAPFEYTNYKSGINIGDEIVLRVKRFEPSQEQLNFNPDEDDPRILQQYVYNYPYTKQKHIDDNGQVYYKYYYWVKLSNNIIGNKSDSIFNLTNSFKLQDNLFMGLTNIVTEVDDTLSSGLYMDYHYGKINKGNTIVSVPFTLKPNSSFLYLQGVKQIENISYMVNGKNIIFDEPITVDMYYEVYQLNHPLLQINTQISQISNKKNKIIADNYHPDYTNVFVNGVKQLKEVSYTFISNEIIFNGVINNISDVELIQINPFELETNKTVVIAEFTDVEIPFEYRSGTGLFVYVNGVKQVVNKDFKLVDRTTIIFMTEDVIGQSVEFVYYRTKNNNRYNSDVSLIPNQFVDNVTTKLDRETYKPVRYNEFFIKGLNNKLRINDNYKLRLTRDYTLRDEPYGLDRKNVHNEWNYLRRNQRYKIDKKLWSHLIDTLCGESIFGQPISVNQYKLYDDRNNSNKRFGLKDGQVLLDKNEAISVVIDSINNIGINYEGFELMDMNEVFSDNRKIRSFMNELYNKAKVSHVNDIFFDVLLESLSKQKDYDGVLKSSFVSLHGIKLLNRYSGTNTNNKYK